MGLYCKICDGERELPAWYVNESEQEVNFYLDLCPCTGKTNHRPGEKKVSQEEHDRLKLEWAKPVPPKDQSFQAAA